MYVKRDSFMCSATHFHVARLMYVQCPMGRLKIIRLFCRIYSPLLGSFAKETHNLFSCVARLMYVQCPMGRLKIIGLFCRIYSPLLGSFAKETHNLFSCSATHACAEPYGAATVRRLLRITGLFCKRALYKGLYSAKETYN